MNTPRTTRTNPAAETRRRRAEEEHATQNTDTEEAPTPNKGALLQRPTRGVIAARFVRDESVPAQRASGVKLVSDASVGGMPQIHLGERLQVFPAMPQEMIDLVEEDMRKHGIRFFSPYASDVTAIYFGHPELARKLTGNPADTLSFKKRGLVPFPPEEHYRRTKTRLPELLHAIVGKVGEKAGVTIPQCVVNALAHRVGCAEMLDERNRKKAA